MELSTFIAGAAAAEASVDALDLIRVGEITNLSGVEEHIRSTMGSILDALLPAAKEEFAKFVEPATQKAIEAVKPAVYEALRDWTPAFATIAGGMIALSVLLGVWVSKRTYGYVARRRSRRKAA